MLPVVHLDMEHQFWDKLHFPKASWKWAGSSSVRTTAAGAAQAEALEH